MKQITLCALVAAVVSLGVYWLGDAFEGAGDDVVANSGAPRSSTSDAAVPAAAARDAALSLRVTEALVEDTWVNAARQPGSDKRTLTSAKTSVCFLTKIEIAGIQAPTDRNSCAIDVDDFTGFWQLIATANEGTRSEVRCNARCLSWEPEGDEP